MPIEVKKGTELRDRYVISDLLGAGAFGIVWRATDKREGRDVAIKRMLRLHGGELETLLDEARKTALLKGHKNIVEVYEVFEDDGEGFLVMEYVDGGTLDDIIRRHILAGTWLDPEDALDYFRQILEGLLFAHSSGLYHRDVKPSNILVSKLGVVKLVDFGLAKPMMPAPAEYEHREPGIAWTGTPNFMSPEQAGGAHLDHLTDIFSAGTVGYILLTGRHPFNHASAVASVYELIKEPGFSPSELKAGSPAILTEPLVKVLIRMLAKEKGSRCQTLLEPLGELEKEPAQSCPRCGAPNPMSNSFCGQCGSALRTVAAAPGPAGLPTAAPQPDQTAESLTDQGFELARRDDWIGAISLYEKAINIEPDFGRAYANLGYALNRLGQFQNAIDLLSKGIERSTDDALLHRLYDTRGFARSRLKDYDGAIGDFTEAVNLNRTNPRVYYHRAESKALAARYDEAYSDVLLALKLDPGYPPALRLRQRLESEGFVRPLGQGMYRAATPA